MSKPFNLSLELVETFDLGVGASCEQTELIQSGISHFAAVSETLSEAKSVQVLVPSKGLFEQVSLPKSLLRLHELINAAARHFGTCREEQDVAGVNARQLDSLETIVCSSQKPFGVEHAEHV